MIPSTQNRNQKLEFHNQPKTEYFHIQLLSLGAEFETNSEWGKETKINCCGLLSIHFWTKLFHFCSLHLTFHHPSVLQLILT